MQLWSEKQLTCEFSLLLKISSMALHRSLLHNISILQVYVTAIILIISVCILFLSALLWWRVLNTAIPVTLALIARRSQSAAWIRAVADEWFVVAMGRNTPGHAVVTVIQKWPRIRKSTDFNFWMFHRVSIKCDFCFGLLLAAHHQICKDVNLYEHSALSTGSYLTLGLSL